MAEQRQERVSIAVVFEHRVLEAALLVLLALNTISIAARYVFNHAIGELFELMILGSVAFYWLGIATAERAKAHLGVSVFVPLLPSSLRSACELLRLIVIAGFLLGVVYSGCLLVAGQLRLGLTSGLLDMPLWLFSVFMPAGAALMLWRVLRGHFAGGRQ